MLLLHVSQYNYVITVTDANDNISSDCNILDNLLNRTDLGVIESFEERTSHYYSHCDKENRPVMCMLITNH